jgi:hypothetical protein
MGKKAKVRKVATKLERQQRAYDRYLLNKIDFDTLVRQMRLAGPSGPLEYHIRHHNDAIVEVELNTADLIADALSLNHDVLHDEDG